MAHEIENLAGRDLMAYVQHDERDVPWHGLGQAISREHGQYASLHEIAKAGGIDWQVHLAKQGSWMFLNPDTGLWEPGVVGEPGHVFRQSDKGANVIRDLDGKILGTVGDWYQPFQNIAADGSDDTGIMEFGEAIVGAEGGFVWDTVMSLLGGKRVAVSLKIPEGVQVLGVDHHDVYLLLSSSHDGSKSLGGYVVFNRTVCKNTHDANIFGAKYQVKIRHVGDLESKVQAAQEALKVTTASAAKYGEVAEKLAEAQFEVEQMEALLEELVTVKGKGDRAARMAVETRKSILGHWETTPTVSDDLRLTKWGAWNAITEWAEWVKPIRPDKRVDRREARYLTVMQGPARDLRHGAYGLLTRR